MTSEPRTRPLPGTVRETATLALPFLLSSIAAAVNHLTDRFFLAQTGDCALEAVLPAGMLANVLTVVLATTIGYSATFIAQYHGGGHNRLAASAFVQGLFLTALAVPLFFLAIPAGFAVLDIAGHAPAVLTAEKSYFLYTQPAGALIVLAAVLGGLFTGQGHTKYVGFCALVGAFGNILFDRLLILGWKEIPALGIQGAGIATILAQALPCILLAARAVRNPLLTNFPVREILAFRPRLAARIVRFGFPAGLNVLVGSGTFTVFTLVLGRLGPLALAVSNAVFAIGNIYYLTATALARAVTITTARARGCNDIVAIRRGLSSGLLLAVLALVAFFAAVLPFGNGWLGLFRCESSAFDGGTFFATGRMLLLILLVREAAEGLLTILIGALRGVGDTKFVLLIQSGIELFFWMPLVFALLVLRPSLYALWLTMPLCLGLSALCLYIRWRSSNWRRISLAEPNQ